MQRLVNAIVGSVVTLATVIATVATAPASIGCRACTTASCDDAPTSAFTELPVPIANLAPNLRVTVCRGVDVDCQSAVLAVSRAYVVTPDKHASYVTSISCAEVGSYYIASKNFSCHGQANDVTGNATLSVYGFEAAQGDVLSVTVTNADDAIVAEHTGVMGLASYSPNGPDCSPTCVRGRF